MATGEVIHDGPAALSASLAPPPAWSVGGLVSVLVASVLLFAASRIRKRGVISGSLLDATHLGEGVVEIVGRDPVHLPSAEKVPVGPVVLVGLRERPARSYREAGGWTVAQIRVGSVEQRTNDRGDRAASLTAAALASLVLGLSPLLVASACGLL